MKSRKESELPFVGLHAHSVAGSPFDALGYPAEHMDFAYDNGMDALALTDHGNANGLAGQVLHAKKMFKEGKEFKPIFGVEAYFIPSVANWKKEYEEIKASAKKKSEYEAGTSGTTVENEVSFEPPKAFDTLGSKSRRSTKHLQDDLNKLCWRQLLSLS